MSKVNGVSPTDEVLVKGASMARLDSFINLLTGLGSSMRDKLLSSQIGKFIQPAPEELAALYESSDFAERIVGALPQESLKKPLGWVNAKLDGQAFTDARNALMGAWKETGALKAVLEGDTWGRLYGDAWIVIGVNDGQTMDQPLNLERVSGVLYLQVVDRRDVNPLSYYRDPLRPKFGEVETWQLNTVQLSTVQSLPSVRVHETRMIRFPGTLTSRRDLNMNGGFHHSVLFRVLGPLRQAASNWDSLCSRMADGSQGVFKLKGLIDSIAAGQEENMRTRMELVDMGRSIIRSLILDAEQEDFKLVESSFEGWAVVIDKTWQRLAAAAKMPVTVLMGMSPAGLNATGDSDLTNWYDQVQSYQTNKLASRINRLNQVLAHAFDVPEPDDWSVMFPALWQMTPKEESELRAKQAETDQRYIQEGVVLPEEIALSRFGGEAYSTETKIDVDMREAARKAEAQAGITPTSEQEKSVEITPSDVAAIVTVNEARASVGLPPITGPDGSLTITEYKAKYSATVAEAEQASQGGTTTAPRGDTATLKTLAESLVQFRMAGVEVDEERLLLRHGVHLAPPTHIDDERAAQEGRLVEAEKLKTVADALRGFREAGAPINDEKILAQHGIAVDENKKGDIADAIQAREEAEAAKADKLKTVADAMRSLREAGAPVDEAKILEEHGIAIDETKKDDDGK